MGIDQVHCLLLGFNPYDRENRAEDFILVYFHAGLHVIKKASAEEVAILIIIYDKVTAIHYQVSTFCDPKIHIALDLVKMLLGNKRSHVVIIVHSRTDFHHVQFGFQFCNHSISHLITDGHNNRNSHATFTTGAISCTHQGADSVI